MGGRNAFDIAKLLWVNFVLNIIQNPVCYKTLPNLCKAVSQFRKSLTNKKSYPMKSLPTEGTEYISTLYLVGYDFFPIIIQMDSIGCNDFPLFKINPDHLTTVSIHTQNLASWKTNKLRVEE